LKTAGHHSIRLIRFFHAIAVVALAVDIAADVDRFGGVVDVAEPRGLAFFWRVADRLPTL